MVDNKNFYSKRNIFDLAYFAKENPFAYKGTYESVLIILKEEVEKIVFSSEAGFGSLEAKLSNQGNIKL